MAFREIEGPNGEIQRYNLNAGQNPPDGVVVTYYLKERPAGEVTLTFKDQNGDVIKRFSTTEDPRVPAEAGTNRFVWDMRYPNARQLSPGAALSSMEWPRAAAPVAAPGKYFVQLEVTGRTREEAFEIRKDPRVPESEADLTAQFTLWMQVRDRLSETADTVHRLRGVREQVEERERRAGQARVKDAAERIKARLVTIEAGLTRVVGRNPMHLPPKGLHQKLATLTNVIGSADGAPTRWTYTVIEELSARLAEYVKQLNALVDSDLTAFLK